MGAAAIAAIAVGAVAIGAVAIRRLLVGQAEFKSVVIHDLTVTRLRADEVIVKDSLQLPGRENE